MKTMRVNADQQGPVLMAAELPAPDAADSEILIRVHAAGVTPTELSWYPTTHAKDGSARTGTVPGHEFSGVIESLGKNVTSFTVGDAVYGMNDWFADGAMAEFCIAASGSIAKKPAKLSHLEAATVPIGALTAWQGLQIKANIQPGERLLIHGGAGAVGLFAVQLAHLRGASVIATTSAATMDFVRALGADRVLDYAAQRFVDEIKDVDVVFDTVGGATRDRSWSVLKPGGRLVTIAADAEGTSEQRVKDAFLLVEANAGQLAEIGRMLDAGTLKTFVKAVVPLQEAAASYSGKVKGQLAYGKTVVAVAP
jgi:NADPH:quinone reductase-like Zn-dependent oxidoreductase